MVTNCQFESLLSEHKKIKMKNCALLFVLLLFTITTQAQAPKIGQVQGTVVDAESDQAVSYATVTVKSVADSTVVTGGLTAENGSFTVSEIPMGEVFVEVSFIGYDSQTFGPYEIKPDSPQHSLGTVTLGQNAAELDAVVVEGIGAAVRYEVDRKVYDASKIKAAEGGTAKDVLEQIPSITVDSQGAIQLRGSQNVRVLVNGRPSSFSLQTLLEQTPQKSIQDIEVITNPSAKYDAEGEAGIINIVLKQNSIEGFTGGFNANYGTEDKYNVGGNLALKTIKWNLTGNLNFNRFDDDFLRDNLRILKSSPGVDQITDENREFYRNGIFAKVGVDHYFDDKNTLFLSGSLNPGNGESNSIGQNTDIITAVGNLSDPIPFGQYDFFRNNDSENDRMGYEVTAGFQHDFNANPRHNLLFDFSYNTGNEEVTNSFTNIYNGLAQTGETINRTFFDSDFTDQENSTTLLSADYTNPFDGKRKFEAGYKSTLQSQDQAFDVVFDGSLVSAGSGVLDFQQDVHAGYFTYEQTFGKVGAKGGLRGEYTDVSSVVEGSSNGEYIDDYFQLFPTANLNYNVTEKTNLNLGYSRRINRPNSRQLTPFADRSDPNNAFQGNNTLRPELTNSYELGFNTNFEKSGLSASIYHRDINDHIRYFREAGESGASTITFRNVEGLSIYGAEGNYDISPAKWMNLNFSANYNYGEITEVGSDDDLQNASTSIFSGRFMNNMRFGGGWGGQVSVNYQSPFAYYQGKLDTMWSTNLNVSKGGLFGGKGNAYLRANDLFNTQGLWIDFDNEVQTQELSLDWPSQMAFLGFNYNFGNLKKPGKRKDQRREEQGDNAPGLGF
mgnify:CR=1 FL=1